MHLIAWRRHSRLLEMSGNENRLKGWLIAGHYGGQNAGDDAMLVGVLRSVPSDLLPGTSIIARSDLLPASPCQRVNMSVGAVLGGLNASRGLILGGGTHFQDEFSGARAVRHFRYMFRFVLLTMLAYLKGKPVLWLGMGFGPVDRASTRWLVRFGSRFCRAITARDAASYEILKACRPRCEIHHAFDLCPLGFETLGTSARADTRVLGLCPVYCSDTSMSSREQDEAFWGGVGETLAAQLAQDTDLQVKIFKFRAGERESDSAVVEQLLVTLRAVAADRVSLVAYQPDPAAMFEEVRSCTHFMSARFHGAMFGWLAGCRLLFVPYHRKVSDLAAEIGLDEHAQWRLDQPHEPAALAAGFNELLGDDARYQAAGNRAEVLKRSEKNRALIERWSTV